MVSAFNTSVDKGITYFILFDFASAKVGQGIVKRVDEIVKNG
jgi:hypothetical protein